MNQKQNQAAVRGISDNQHLSFLGSGEGRTDFQHPRKRRIPRLTSDIFFWDHLAARCLYGFGFRWVNRRADQVVSMAQIL